MGVLQRSRVWQKEEDSILGLNREAARNASIRLQVSLCKATELQPCVVGESIEFLKKTYLNGDLWLWRVLLPSGSDVLAGFVRSPESAHFS